MIWNMEDNVGLTSYDEELSELTSFYPTLKEEVLKATSNITKDIWYSLTNVRSSAANYIHGEGKYYSLPFFYYGKRRRLICKDLLPKTCKFVKDTIPRAANLKYGTVKLNVLDPKTKTVPLESLTNLKLRILMPIQVPEGFQIVLGKDTSVPLKEGQWNVIDDSFERVFDNEKSDKAAIWLSLDIPHPDMGPQDEKSVSITIYAKTLFLYF